MRLDPWYVTARVEALLALLVHALAIPFQIFATCPLQHWRYNVSAFWSSCLPGCEAFCCHPQGSGSVLATRNTGLVRERSSTHAWDLSGEGGIHAHSQFLHLKLRSAARLGALLAAEQEHGRCIPVEDASAEPLSCEHNSQQRIGDSDTLKEKGGLTQSDERVRLSTEELKSLGLRYFSPREIARLHSFPEAFSFPQHVTLRQQYALLGNSVSALVIAELLQYLLHDIA